MGSNGFGRIRNTLSVKYETISMGLTHHIPSSWIDKAEPVLRADGDVDTISIPNTYDFLDRTYPAAHDVPVYFRRDVRLNGVNCAVRG